MGNRHRSKPFRSACNGAVTAPVHHSSCARNRSLRSVGPAVTWTYQEVTVDELRRVPGWDKYPPEVLGPLARWVEVADLESGDLLTREGLQGVRAFLIVSGIADVTVAGSWRASVRAGEMVGSRTLAPRQPRTATVTARTPMRVIVFDAAAVHEFRENPAVQATPGAQ